MLNRRHRAYHEAGHTLVAHVLGMDVKQASIKIDWEAGHGGYAEHLAPKRIFKAFVEGPDGLFRRNARGERVVEVAYYRKMATVLFAGAEAACRAVGSWDANSPGLAGSEQDMYEAVAISTTAFGECRRDWLKRCRQRAHDLVAEHWEQIEALAGALVKRGTLSGDQIREIIG